MEFAHYKYFIIIIIPSHHPLLALYIRSYYPPLLACLQFSRFSLVPCSPLSLGRARRVQGKKTPGPPDKKKVLVAEKMS